MIAVEHREAERTARQQERGKLSKASSRRFSFRKLILNCLGRRMCERSLKMSDLRRARARGLCGVNKAKRLALCKHERLEREP
jgi:hypothetical protein